jgi:hypothetical protein
MDAFDAARLDCSQPWCGHHAGLQQLIRIDVDGHGDVFGEWQFVQRFAHEALSA